MLITEDEVTNLMDLLKIPVEKRNFAELKKRIQNLMEKNDNFLDKDKNDTEEENELKVESCFKKEASAIQNQINNENESKRDDDTCANQISATKILEKFFNNPGLQHLAENIFWNLEIKDLKICAQINQSCKLILQNPMFCLMKFEHMSIKNKNDWIKVIQSVKNSDKGIAIISYLKWNLKKEVVDPPCYSNLAVQNDFRKQILECCTKRESSDENIEIVKILAPLTDNPKGPRF